MRNLIFISTLLTVLISCWSNEKLYTDNRGLGIELPHSNGISLEIKSGGHFLEDSVVFYNFVCDIVSNKEYGSDKEFIPGCETITSRIYQFVYQTPDSIISLTRKMDLLQMLVFYYRRGANYYLHTVESKLEENKDDIASRPILLFPFIHSREFSKKLMGCLLKNDKIDIPLEYFTYSNQVLDYLNTLPRKNLEESFKRLHSDSYVRDPNIRVFLSKEFQNKYRHLKCWTILP